MIPQFLNMKFNSFFSRIAVLLLNTMIAHSVDNVDKTEMRHLLRKLEVPEDRIKEIEENYKGKENLRLRVEKGLEAWREIMGPWATPERFARVIHLIGLTALDKKIQAIKMFSERIRF